uniref:DUF4116 domain-containing protein n=1 Tax=viral metagenome TaxID=1070528 RepID=A0A6C0AE13_9ZZZZ
MLRTKLIFQKFCPLSRTFSLYKKTKFFNLIKTFKEAIILDISILLGLMKPVEDQVQVENQKYELDIKQNPLCLEFANNKTQELCDLAVYNNIVAFLYIPSEFMTNEMLEYVIKKNPLLLRNIPENKQTEYLCELAMDLNPDTYEYVCDKNRTENYYIRCILKCENSNGIRFSRIICYIPDSRKTEKICHYLALKGCLDDVPEHLRTYELCKTALKSANNSISIYTIPKKYHAFLGIKNGRYILP